MRAVRGILAVVLAALFGVAGALKLGDPAQFARDIANFQLIAPPWSAMLAVYLPWLELLAAAALLVPRWHQGATAVVLGLSVGFVAALASAWWRNLDIACGCFGAASATTTGTALLRSIVITLLAATLLWLARRRPRDGSTRSFVPESSRP